LKVGSHIVNSVTGTNLTKINGGMAMGLDNQQKTDDIMCASSVIYTSYVHLSLKSWSSPDPLPRHYWCLPIRTSSHFDL